MKRNLLVLLLASVLLTQGLSLPAMERKGKLPKLYYATEYYDPEDEKVHICREGFDLRIDFDVKVCLMIRICHIGELGFQPEEEYIPGLGKITTGGPNWKWIPKSDFDEKTMVEYPDRTGVYIKDKKGWVVQYKHPLSHDLLAYLIFPCLSTADLNQIKCASILFELSIGRYYRSEFVQPLETTVSSYKLDRRQKWDLLSTMENSGRRRNVFLLFHVQPLNIANLRKACKENNFHGSRLIKELMIQSLSCESTVRTQDDNNRVWDNLKSLKLDRLCIKGLRALNGQPYAPIIFFDELRIFLVNNTLKKLCLPGRCLSDFGELVSDSKHLTTLECSLGGNEADLSKLPKKLIVLILRKAEAFTDNGFRVLGERCQNLRELSIENSSADLADGMDGVQSGLHTLKNELVSITFITCPKISGDTFEILQGFKNLRVFIIEFSLDENAYGLSLYDCKLFPSQVKRIDFLNWKNGTNDKLSEILGASSRLEKLRLERNSGLQEELSIRFTGEDGATLPKGLKCLEICGCPEVIRKDFLGRSYCDFTFIGRMCPELESFTVICSPHLKPRDLRGLPETLKYLSLDVQSCRMTDEFVGQLIRIIAKRFPNLREIQIKWPRGYKGLTRELINNNLKGKRLQAAREVFLWMIYSQKKHRQ